MGSSFLDLGQNKDEIFDGFSRKRLDLCWAFKKNTRSLKGFKEKDEIFVGFSGKKMEFLMGFQVKDENLMDDSERYGRYYWR